MIPLLLSALTSKITGPIASILCVLLAVGFVNAKCEAADLSDSIEKPVTGWRAKLAHAEHDRDLCRVNEATLKTAIADQNHAVDALAVESATRTARAEQLASQAAREARTAQTTANRILSSQPGSDACESAMSLIREAAR